MFTRSFFGSSSSKVHQQLAVASAVSLATFLTHWQLHQSSSSSSSSMATTLCDAEPQPNKSKLMDGSHRRDPNNDHHHYHNDPTSAAFARNKSGKDGHHHNHSSQDVHGDESSSNNNKDVPVQRRTTDLRKLRQSDAHKADDDKTTFYGQCLQRQLFRPKLPYPAWDYDWDHRETEATSQEAMSGEQHFVKSKSLGKTRHLLLIRHGQYDERYKEDRRRKLTPLGRHQAELTGQRLALYARGGLGNMIKKEFSGPLNIKCIHTSDMERAKETARIIASHLPHVPLLEPDPMLNEALPAPMIPIRPDIRAVREIDANHSRIEAAFQKYVHRASPEDEYHNDEQHGHDDHHHHNNHHNNNPQAQHHHGQHDEHDHHQNPHGVLPHPEHEFEILVGHGNIIRYFFCRSLQLPPEAWLRISTFNCSITYLMIYPNGYVSCRMLGDVGHLGYDNTTFSGSYGYNW